MESALVTTSEGLVERNMRLHMALTVTGLNLELS